MPFSDQLKQLVELHRVAELAMMDLIIRLWPDEAMPGSYFGLVKRLVNACPRLDVVKRSACIEGACMAFARVKGVVGKDGRRQAYDRGTAKGQGVPHTRAVFCRCPGGVSHCSNAMFARHYLRMNTFMLSLPCMMKKSRYVI